MTAMFESYPSTWERADWLRWRRAGCGGSDVAAICGLSTFGSPLAVYFDKLGVTDDEPENEAMRWGRLLEQPIVAEFERETGLFVVEPQCLVWDGEHHWRRATLDGLVVESNAEWPHDAMPGPDALLGVLEVKTTGDYSWHDDHGGIPDRVALQVQWQLGVAELDHAWLAVLHQGRRFRVYEVDADPAVYAALCGIVDRFWSSHVVAKTPPSADSNPATTAALKAAYASGDNGAVMLDDEALFWAREWLPLKTTLANAKANVDFCENRLRAALGDAIEGCDELGPVVTWKPQRKGGPRLDEKLLKAAHPEIYAEFEKPEETVRVLRPTKALRDLEKADA